jgi:hypothetical protein
MNKFLQKFPHIARYWNDPEKYLANLPVTNSANIQYESWDLVAKRLLA